MPFFLGQEWRKIKYFGNVPELSDVRSSYIYREWRQEVWKPVPGSTVILHCQETQHVPPRHPVLATVTESYWPRWRYPHFEIFLYFSMQRHALQINWTGMFMLALGSLWSAEMRRDRYTCVSRCKFNVLANALFWCFETTSLFLQSRQKWWGCSQEQLWIKVNEI